MSSRVKGGTKLKTQEKINWKNDVLMEILEEFEKGNDIETQKFIDFMVKYDNRDCKTKLTEEEENDQIEEIKWKFNLDKDTKWLNMKQCIDYILEEIETESKEGLLEAFQVFDEEETGKVKLSILKGIMEDFGPLGYSLNDDQLLRLMNMFKNEFEYVNFAKEKDIKPDGDSTEEKETHVEVVEFVRGSRHIKYIKDFDIDYREFVKKMMDMINYQEKNLWGSKE